MFLWCKLKTVNGEGTSFQLSHANLVCEQMMSVEKPKVLIAVGQ